MFESPVKIRDLILFSFFSLMVTFIIFSLSFFDKQTKIIFCDVGQGDATYIRIDNKIDVLIDAGPDNSILSCLGKYMPFWDRKIELAFLSHPNNDHYNGYFFIIDRYKIDRFFTVDSAITSKNYKKLLNIINMKQIPLSFTTSGDRLKPGNAVFEVYWPPKGFNSSNDNDYSSVVLFECCKGAPRSTLTVLFTGDASKYILGRLSHGAIKKVNILKIPHHGSKNGLTKNFLDLADPTLVVISVGKNNSYGHPSNEVLSLIKAKNIKILRTDIDGDVVFNLKE